MGEGGIINKTQYDTSVINSSNVEITVHFLVRAAERGISKEDIIDSLDNYLKEKEIRYDEEGKPSFQRIGETVTTAINPQNRKLVSVWKTHSKLSAKLKRSKTNESKF